MSVIHLSWAWQQSLGDPTTKLILMKLADGADESNRSWYSHQTLAKQCETSVSTVRRHLRLLREKKIIEIIPRHNDKGQTSNYYQINMDTPGQIEHPPIVTSEHPPCSSMTTPPVHSYEQRPINDPLKDPIYNSAFEEEELKKIIKNPSKLKDSNSISVRPEDMLFQKWWDQIPWENGAVMAKAEYRKALQKTDHDTLCKKAVEYYQHQIEQDKKSSYWVRPWNWLKHEHWLDDMSKADKKPSEIGLKKPEPEVYGFDSNWKRRVEDWKSNGFWLEKLWGDNPDSPRTGVPIHIQKEFKVGKYKQCNST